MEMILLLAADEMIMYSLVSKVCDFILYFAVCLRTL